MQPALGCLQCSVQLQEGEQKSDQIGPGNDFWVSNLDTPLMAEGVLGTCVLTNQRPGLADCGGQAISIHIVPLAIKHDMTCYDFQN